MPPGDEGALPPFLGSNAAQMVQLNAIGLLHHNKADHTWAEWITWQLEAAGYKATLQAWDFRTAGRSRTSSWKCNERPAKPGAPLLCSRRITFLFPVRQTQIAPKPRMSLRSSWHAGFSCSVRVRALSAT